MIQSIANALKRFGILGLFENTIIHCLSRIGITLCVMEIYGLELLSITEIKGLSNIRYLTLSDFEKQTLLNPNWFGKGKIEDMKNSFAIEGNIPVGIFENNLLIAYGWVSLNKLGLENLQLKDKDGYLWDDYTHPDYRGKGLHSIINNVRVSILKKAGKERALTQVAHYNRASRVGYLKSGFTLVDRYVQLKIGNYNYTTIKI